MNQLFTFEPLSPAEIAAVLFFALAALCAAMVIAGPKRGE